MARPKVLFAWEMGGNFGHVAKIATVARCIHAFADVTVALREPAALRKVAPDLPVTILPAPFASTTKRSVYNYSGMLLTEGWGDVSTLSSLVETWRTLFEFVKPDLLVAQAAPTALLAACGMPIRRMILGSGYDFPPFATPMPPFDSDIPESAEVIPRHEAEIVRNANAALMQNGSPQQDNFCAMQRVDASALVTWPEADHYGDRRALQPDAPPYLGQILGLSSGEQRMWTDRKGAKIFAYLRVGTAAGSAGLGALHAFAPEADIICAAPGISHTDAENLQNRGIQIVDGPVQLNPLLPDCDLVITHGSAGVASTALVSGIRQIALPTHREQALFARTLARQKLAVSMEGRYDSKNVLDVIQKVVANPGLKTHLEHVAGDLKQRFADSPESRTSALIQGTLQS